MSVDILWQFIFDLLVLFDADVLVDYLFQWFLFEPILEVVVQGPVDSLLDPLKLIEHLHIEDIVVKIHMILCELVCQAG